MKIAFSFLMSILVLNFCFAQKPSTIPQKENKSKNPIDPKYRAVDSVSLEYIDAIGIKTYYVTFNRNSITTTTDDGQLKVITNSDTVQTMINYVDSLFISGTEKTEIGRSFLGSFSYTGSDKLIIRLFINKNNYVTHTIDYDPPSSSVEFSPSFIKFNHFLKEVMNYK